MGESQWLTKLRTWNCALKEALHISLSECQATSGCSQRGINHIPECFVSPHTICGPLPQLQGLGPPALGHDSPWMRKHVIHSGYQAWSPVALTSAWPEVGLCVSQLLWLSVFRSELQSVDYRML